MAFVSFSHELPKGAGTGGEMGEEAPHLGLDLPQAISAPVLGFSNRGRAKIS